MNNKTSIFRTMMILLVTLVIFCFPEDVLSDNGLTHIFVDPTASQVTTCSTQEVAIHVENVENLTGYHLEIGFDAAVVQVTDVVNGGFLAPPGEPALYEPTNDIDNVNGLITFGLVQQGAGTGDPDPKSGEGDLILITFQALVPNQTSAIEIDSVNSQLVSWPDVSEIDFTATDGVINTESCPPTNIDLSKASIPENEPAGTELGTFATDDPDLPDDSFTYDLVSGAGDDDNESFDIVTSSLRSKEVFNYEDKSVYSIRVRSTDAGGKSIEQIFGILILDVNDPPVAYSQDIVTKLEEPIAITLTAFDEDGDDLTYEILSGPDHGTLTGAAPNLTYTPNDDFTGADRFTFRVFDGLAYSNTATIIITTEPKIIFEYVFPDFRQFKN